MTKHMRMERVLSLGIALLAGLGCAASGPVFSRSVPKPGTALIHIYRLAETIGGGASYCLGANQELITIITNGGYYTYVASPGNTTFSMKHKPGIIIVLRLRPFQDVITVPAEAGEIYFVRFDYVGRMELVSTAEGEREIQELHRFERADEC